MTVGQPAIAVATSIPPRLTRYDEGKRVDEDYQRLCISSWIAAGFRVLSINDRDEIAALSSRYPGVEFVVTERNASAWTGRKNPYIADLLEALKDVPEPVVGIINSDLVFESTPAWERNLPAALSGAIVIGHRYDATSLLKGALRRFWPGFDYFFFDKAMAKTLSADAMPFAMGLPFWDYWVPIAAAVSGRKVNVLERPSVVHLMHAHGYEPVALGDFARIFANVVIKYSERAVGPLPRAVSEILPTCRAVLALPPATETGFLMDKVTEIITVFLPHIRQNIVSFDSERDGSAAGRDGSAAAVFAAFDRRRVAGEALEKAKGFVHKGNPGAAEREFRIAAKATPEDSEIPLSFGEFLFSRGNPKEACQFLRNAVQNAPGSARPLNSLGVALHATGKRDEAVDCFKKALRIDPKFKDVYPNLAVALLETNRSSEAIYYLRQALNFWPDFTDAAQLYARIAGAPRR
jgi:Flp pilus assembly protein TadD